MRKQYSRIAALVMALTAGGLAAFALRPAAGNTAATPAARNPAVEVRTQVIRRTIHVIRHEPGARLHGSRGAHGSVLAVGSGTGHARARTGASGARRAARSVATGVAVATRTSGSHGTASAPASQGQSHPVITRSSGSHGTSSGAAAGSSGHPVTRSSGGGHGHGEDGGDGNGHDD